jgi:hypothetical protein
VSRRLNSTLSVRVEELNAQISSLYVENLRLRASEISLASQLKKEKENSQRVVDEAESAVRILRALPRRGSRMAQVGTLMKHITSMRTSFNIRPTKPGPSCECLLHMSRTAKLKVFTASPAKRKPPSSPVQPPRETIRLVKPPAETITQIRESDEEDADEEDDTPTRVMAARRPSTSRLPLPKLVSAPPPPRPTAIPHINLAGGTTKRKVGRRNSALLTVEHVSGVERAPSPVARSARRGRRSSLDEEREVELEVQVGAGIGLDVVPMSGTDREEEEIDVVELLEVKKAEDKPMKTDRKGKGRELSKEWERETEPYSTSERESSEGAREKEKRRFGIKDVTNSPRKSVSEFADEKPAEETGESHEVFSKMSSADVRTAPPPASTLTTPSSAHTALFDTLTPRPSGSPLASAASTPATDGGSEGGEGTNGRERRTRKSVNYAEPKLNTYVPPHCTHVHLC